MNELDGDIRRFLTRLTDAAPDAPDVSALGGHQPSPSGRPTARFVGALAVVALFAAGAWAALERGTEPTTGDATRTSVATTRATPAVLCAYGPRSMPSVVGLPLADAESVLSAPCMDVSVEVHEVPSSDVPAGVVLTQSVAPGSSVNWRGAVVLEVAVASSTDVVCSAIRVRVLPSVVGRTATDAESVLAAPCLGLTVVTEEVTDRSMPAGVVVAQLPPAGELVEHGAVVRLTIAAERSEARGYVVVGSFTLANGRPRQVELKPGGICTSAGDDSTRGCDTLPASLSPLVVRFGAAEDPQEMWGVLDPGLTVRVERDGVAMPVQQTTEPVGGHLALYGLVPAGGRLTISVVDASGAVVKRLDDPAR